jgi:tRNA-binding protein
VQRHRAGNRDDPDHHDHGRHDHDPSRRHDRPERAHYDSDLLAGGRNQPGHHRSPTRRLAASLLAAGRPTVGHGPLSAEPIDLDHFRAVDLRVGRVLAVEDFPEARVPAWKLTIDFGPEVGVKRSSAQITNYAREQLQGRLVVAVVNFPPRRIGPFSSEVLVLGALDATDKVVLLAPDEDVEPGAPIA